ncbi:SurA N-terminal domain-containing protein [Microbacterium sp. G2-8]|uniref:SurA N-terminal domain-containing protein n=1 Tax=Microbacterium sp. G2-8 TaxID=2842454 RepID=UPI001C8A20B9|nr:SurA N-terminal domain-containing protein [Microbacterium sp. G2-8]
MSITRPLLAVSAVAMLALTGCSAAGSEDGAEKTPSATENPDSAAPKADLKGVPDVVAEVNGEEVGLEEFTTAYEGQLQQAAMTQQQTGQEVDQEALKGQVADMLVNNLLLTQAAADAGIDATDEDIDGQLQALAEQNGLESVDAVISAFDDQGVSEKEVREDAAVQAEIDQFIQGETDIAEPSDEELKKQYDALVEQTKAQGEEAAAQIPPFKEVRDQIAQQAVAEEENAAVGEILKGLKKDADVKINL